MTPHPAPHVQTAPFTAYWLDEGIVGKTSLIVYGRDVDCRAYLARVAPVFEDDDPDYFPIDDDAPAYATAERALQACQKARADATRFIAAMTGDVQLAFIRRVEAGGVLA